jgi:hypothetical protein
VLLRRKQLIIGIEQGRVPASSGKDYIRIGRHRRREPIEQK